VKVKKIEEKEMAADCFSGRLQSGKEGKDFGVEK